MCSSEVCSFFISKIEKTLGKITPILYLLLFEVFARAGSIEK
jgi:hypothetical protein